MDVTPDPVVVVGAGPTGVTAAILLADLGVPVVVLERWPEVYPRPRAVHLDDEVHRILARMGLAADFAAISRPAQGLRLVDRRHRVLAEIDRSGPAPASGFPRANMFDQPVLEQLLRAHLATRPLATLRSGVEVTKVVDRGDHVEVRLADGEAVRAAYVLGCDGAGSVVRESIGSTLESLGFEQRWLVVDVETTADLGLWEGVHQVCDSRRAATYMRIGETRYRWEWRLLDGETDADHATLDQLAPLLAPWLDAVDGDLGALELVRTTSYTFRAAIADRWRSGRVFVLGDAAHLTPPFIGQGMGAGLRDADNLAWKLAGVLDGTLPADVLETYEAERKPHARELIGLARMTGIAMTSGGRVGDAVRRGAVPIGLRMPVLAERIADSVTPALGVSHRRGDRLAGTLAPGALDADPGWVLVSRDAVAPGERRSLTASECRVVQARDGALAAWLDGGRAGAALVRPDRTVHVSHASVVDVCATAHRVLAYGDLDVS